MNQNSNNLNQDNFNTQNKSNKGIIIGLSVAGVVILILIVVGIVAWNKYVDYMYQKADDEIKDSIDYIDDLEDIIDNNNQDDNAIPEELYDVAVELANKNFDLSLIFKKGFLSFTNEVSDVPVAKVNDVRYKTFSELENDVKNTYVDEVVNELLYSDENYYFDQNGELYINLLNAGHANVYTGRGPSEVNILNYDGNTFNIEYCVTAYMDDKHEVSENLVLNLKAVKQSDGSWKLSEMK